MQHIDQLVRCIFWIDMHPCPRASGIDSQSDSCLGEREQQSQSRHAEAIAMQA